MNEHRAGTEQVSPDAISTLAGNLRELNIFIERNRYDLQLYEYAKSIVYHDLLEEGLSTVNATSADSDSSDQMFRLLNKMASRKQTKKTDSKIFDGLVRPPLTGLSGVGGNTSICVDKGQSDFRDCQRYLFQSEHCQALTFKASGNCILHNIRENFRVEQEPDSTFQMIEKSPHYLIPKEKV